MSAISVYKPGIIRQKLKKGTPRHQVVLVVSAVELHIHSKSILTSFSGLIEDSWLMTL